MTKPSDAQVEAAVRAFWETFEKEHAGLYGRANAAAGVAMLNGSAEIRTVIRLSMRAALTAASKACA